MGDKVRLVIGSQHDQVAASSDPEMPHIVAPKRCGAA
jgi:hypothetical protein